MGLGIEVGLLADLLDNDPVGYEYFKEQFDAINECLKRNGLPKHMEPEYCDIWSTEMYGYSGLHCLRRIAACLESLGGLPSSPGDIHSSDDPILRRYYEGLSSASFDHLINHSDAEGYYLPVKFPRVIYPEHELGIAGGMIGSAHRLLEECRRIAEALEIPDDLDENSKELWEAADHQGESPVPWEKFGIESFSCVCLIRGCERSIQNGAALVFC
ncbi:MAG: hypothetical protein ACKVX9_07500 [Blastocatellia bacterium]